MHENFTFSLHTTTATTTDSTEYFTSSHNLAPTRWIPTTTVLLPDLPDHRSLIADLLAKISMDRGDKDMLIDRAREALRSWDFLDAVEAAE
jgi:hypothetical protein